MSLADELIADLDFEEVGSEEDEEIDEEIDKRKYESDESDEEENLNKRLKTSSDIKELLNKRLANSIQHILNQIKNTDSNDYNLVVDANNLIAEIDTELLLVNKFIRDHYAKKFPELESLVLNTIDYVRAVKIIGNTNDITKVDKELRNFLPSATVMVITVTFTTTRGENLQVYEIERIQEACIAAENLDEARNTIVTYVESRMSLIAPNLSYVVGSTTAARLMGAAGGLHNLSNIPACNLSSLGASKRVLTGFSSANPGLRSGYLGKSDFIKTIPPDLRKRALRIFASKAVLAARVDSVHEAPDGGIGRKFRAEIDAKLDKFQEPPKMRDVKALVAPDEPRKKRRGGKRFRKLKELYGQSDIQKQQNRLAFGTEAEDEVYHFDETEGLGMLGKSMSTGKVRASAQDGRPKHKGPKGLAKKVAAAGGTTSTLSGLTSSLAFTPVAGLELISAVNSKKKVEEANAKWFNNYNFINVKKDSEQLPK